MKRGSIAVICVLAAVAVASVVIRHRNHRSITFLDLSKTQSRTVSISFLPMKLRWRINGRVDGDGTLVISDVYSNLVSGKIATNGSIDYYGEKVKVTFIPNGAASGKLRADFWFTDFIESENNRLTTPGPDD